MLEYLAQQIINLTLISMLLRFTAPILLAAIGGLFCHKVGSTNIGLEGLMVISAFASIGVNAASGNWIIGMLAGIIASILLSLLLAFFALKYNVHIIIAGFVINIFASALTVFLMMEIFGVAGAYVPKFVNTIPILSFRFINEIPVINKLLNGHSLVVWIAFLSVIISQIVFNKTPYGMHIRAIGENIDAAKSLGIRVELIQYSTFVWCGLFCGIAGAFLSTGVTSIFVRDMTAGIGFIALAVIFLGNSKPVGVLFASLLFGLTNAVVILIQTMPDLKVSSQYIQAIPYAITVIVLIFYAIRLNSEKYFMVRRYIRNEVLKNKKE